MPKGSELSTRSDMKELAEHSGGAPTFATVLDADADAAASRIVEAFSLDNAPFEMEISWSTGTGSGPKARVTLARSGRVAIYARGLRIRAANLSSSRNRVGVCVADGTMSSRNVLEIRGTTADDGAATEVEIPPFAEEFTVDLADPDVQAHLEVRVYDGVGTLRARYAGGSQIQGGVLVGGAGRVEISSPEPADYRVIYQLSL